jgi:two-component system KDP operon response regulator KdpE
VLVLTVQDTLRDKVTALDLGADDYMVKPFEPEELLARARAQLRRTVRSEPAPAVITIGSLVVDSAKGLVTWDGAQVSLTPTEFRVLDTLLEHRGRLVRHEELLDAVWGQHRRPGIDNLRVFVLRLRRKLHDDTARPYLIVSEPGLGYRWIGGEYCD